MTDEERKETCEALRNGNAHYWKQEWYNELSDEIERLAEENDRFRRALVSAWRKIEENAAILDPERSET